MNVRFLMPAAILVAAFSCARPQCELELAKFASDDEAPFIYIDSMVAPCTYGFTGHFFHRSRTVYDYDVVLKGRLQFADSAITILPDSAFRKPVKLFDFTKRTGESYNLAFHLVDTSFQYRASIDTLVRSPKYGNISLFRLHKSFPVSEGYDASDMVFVVSTHNGILGSFTSEKLANGIEYVSFQQGNLLPSLINYSNKTDAVIK